MIGAISLQAVHHAWIRLYAYKYLRRYLMEIRELLLNFRACPPFLGIFSLFDASYFKLYHDPRTFKGCTE